MREISVAVVGGGIAAVNALRALSAHPGVRIRALVDPSANSPAHTAAVELGVPVVTQWRKVAQHVDVMIETTLHTDDRAELRRELPRTVALIEGTAFLLTDSLLAQLNRVARSGEFAELLSMALQVIHEGVEIADGEGFIRYMNPACLSILGIDPSERVGRSIFDVSPDGGIAQVLKSGRTTAGIRNRPTGTSVEVVSNASPIYHGNKLVGGVSVFRDITELRRLSRELEKNKALVESLYQEIGALNNASYTFANLVGNGPPLREAVEVGTRAAASTSTVLIEGETGTGKEIMAHAIHNASQRRERAFIKINSAAIPETLLESEFFGYEKGAFTGATRRKPGKLELANGGTIFLDEVGDMSPTLQVKLLRVLQEKQFERVGGSERVQVDVRVIAATNANLDQLMAKGLFRRDLYYRLNVVSIKMPSLRARREDLPLLIRHILQRMSRKVGHRVHDIAPDAEALFLRYDWPGNVRELENLLERVVHVVDHDVITEKDLRGHCPALVGDLQPGPEAITTLEESERLLIKKAIDTFGNSLEGKKKAAEALGISLSTLYNKIRSTAGQGDSENRNRF